MIDHHILLKVLTPQTLLYGVNGIYGFCIRGSGCNGSEGIWCGICVRLGHKSRCFLVACVGHVIITDTKVHIQS